MEDQDIHFPNVVDPRKEKVMRGLGVRETVLVSAAGLQAVYLIFVATSIEFALRISVAVGLALALLIVAVVPVRGYTLEQWLARLIRRALRPRLYLHQTAAGETYDLSDTATSNVPAAPPQPAIAAKPAVSSAGTLALPFDGPYVALLMLLFWFIVVGGGVLTYLVRQLNPATGW